MSSSKLPPAYVELLEAVAQELARRAATSRDGQVRQAFPSKSILGTLGSRSKSVMQRVRSAVARDASATNLHSVLAQYGSAFGIEFDAETDSIALSTTLPPAMISQFRKKRPRPGSDAFDALLETAAQRLAAELASRQANAIPATELGARQEMVDIRAAYVAAGMLENYKLHSVLQAPPFASRFVIVKVGAGPGYEIRLRPALGSRSSSASLSTSSSFGSVSGGKAATARAISPAHGNAVDPYGRVAAVHGRAAHPAPRPTPFPDLYPSDAHLGLGDHGRRAMRLSGMFAEPHAATSTTSSSPSSSANGNSSQSSGGYNLAGAQGQAQAAPFSFVTRGTLHQFYAELDRLPPASMLALDAEGTLDAEQPTIPLVQVHLPAPVSQTYLFHEPTWDAEAAGAGTTGSMWDHLRVLVADAEFTLVVFDAARLAGALLATASPLDLGAGRTIHDARVIDIAVAACVVAGKRLPPTHGLNECLAAIGAGRNRFADVVPASAVRSATTWARPLLAEQATRYAVGDVAHLVAAAERAMASVSAVQALRIQAESLAATRAAVAARLAGSDAVTKTLAVGLDAAASGYVFGRLAGGGGGLTLLGEADSPLPDRSGVGSAGPPLPRQSQATPPPAAAIALACLPTHLAGPVAATIDAHGGLERVAALGVDVGAPIICTFAGGRGAAALAASSSVVTDADVAAILARLAMLQRAESAEAALAMTTSGELRAADERGTPAVAPVVYGGSVVGEASFGVPGVALRVSQLPPLVAGGGPGGLTLAVGHDWDAATLPAAVLLGDVCEGAASTRGGSESILIVGPRRSGKTSLLRAVARRAAARARHVLIVVSGPAA
ncbi:uncharacterized protein AMSG_11187 [Thecamonas trahens ATCC 50062]|uniref:Uncharacterized protein n=1 Tax=Thecamonas trahens ATCC 50062 TaxID=461836 RepID=A0A0L0DTZ2_THETB|nr:hypothetical protein AMSG_11187 [Thecamonas trahens ATCC 50062]KNC55725.1 hypothetical protein AMSG_11187 [Thecamonas trahens ATCC 50062]|eukprot:XP_013752933.1 hypothetical protein AMSG_11187 [Thecamonas trahens ATCC 50062]